MRSHRAAAAAWAGGAFDAEVVAGEHFDANPIAVHEFAGFGDPAEPLADEASDGGGFNFVFAVEGIEEVGDAIEVEISGIGALQVNVVDE